MGDPERRAKVWPPAAVGWCLALAACGSAPAPQEDPPQTSQQELDASWQVLVPSARVADDLFGQAVGIDHDTAIVGAPGSGKSTVMKNMIGLLPPLRGQVLFGDIDLFTSDPAMRERVIARFGVMYQSGALFGSMTLLFGGDDPLLGGPGYLDPMSIIGIFAAIFGISIAYEVLCGIGPRVPRRLRGCRARS